MGDRANVILKGNDNVGTEITLYTHWNGSEVEKIIATGLKKAVDGGRNTDQSYAQRIIAQAFFDAHGQDVTGAGLYAGPAYEPHVVTVDFDEQTVTFDPQAREYGTEGEDPTTAPFADFIALFLEVPASV